MNLNSHGSLGVKSDYTILTVLRHLKLRHWRSFPVQRHLLFREGESLGRLGCLTTHLFDFLPYFLLAELCLALIVKYSSYAKDRTVMSWSLRRGVFVAIATFLFRVYLILNDLTYSLENFRPWKLFACQNLVNYALFGGMLLCVWDVEELFVRN